MTSLNCVFLTDKGLVRENNQDTVLCSKEQVGCLPNLFIVADGMGGHKGGEHASKKAVECFIERIKNTHAPTLIGRIKESISYANDSLLKDAEADPELVGMGTTFVMSTVIDDVLYVANIGDSRLYLVNDDIRQITTDHSLVQEMVDQGTIKKEDARFHPKKNVITRALGTEMNIDPDCFEVPLKKDDTVLMCSDGLSNMMDDVEIKEIIRENGNDINTSCEKLLKLAYDNGGKDNISILLVHIE